MTHAISTITLDREQELSGVDLIDPSLPVETVCHETAQRVADLSARLRRATWRFNKRDWRKMNQRH